MNSSNGNILAQDVIAYNSMLASIKSNINSKLTKSSNNAQEHEELKRKVEESLNTCVLEIEQSNLPLSDKIALSNAAKRYYNDIVEKDMQQMEKKKQLINQKKNAVYNNFRLAIDSELLDENSKARIEEYKQRKEAKARVFKAMLALTIILAILTIGAALIFLTPWLKDKQKEKYSDLEYKHQEDIMNGAKNELDDDMIKKIVGSNDITINETINITDKQEFTVKNGDTTTYYRYDKTTDTLSSATTSDGEYKTISNGDNYLANHGGWIKSDNNSEKVIMIGEHKYSLDKNSLQETITVDDKKYDRYLNGVPFFVKAHDNEYTKFIYAGIPATVGFATGALVTGLQKDYAWGKYDEETVALDRIAQQHERNKNNMKIAFNNATAVSMGSGLNNVGIGAGKAYGEKLKKLQDAYDNLDVRESMNAGNIAGLENGVLSTQTSFDV